jgi:Tol biopolymer transport system component
VAVDEQLTHDFGNNLTQVSSPDGAKIAFLHQAYPTLPPADIWVMNPDGTALIDITNSPEAADASPDWQSLPRD